MGNWQLEVAKMAIYMAFPVALFHYFNQPEYFEEWVTKMKREIYPPHDPKKYQDVQDLIKKLQEKHEKKMLQALEEESSKT